MLRPLPKSSSSYARSSRSPSIRPTDDDHPLLIHLQEAKGPHARTDAVGFSRDNNVNGYARPSSVIPIVDEPSSSDRSNSPAERKRQLDTEVYVHRVMRSDTLPRIILQYQISTPVLRRANKLWTNDSIQSKEVLFLPVGACEVKPDMIDFEDSARSLASSGTTTKESSCVDGPTHPPSSRVIRTSTESAYVHRISPLASDKSREKSATEKSYRVVRQVLIDGIGLVDVALVAGASLSYFPPSVSTRHLVGHDDSTTTTATITMSRHSTDRHRESLDTPRRERGSFEAMRVGAGQMAADAYNGTQGLIRRLKDKHNAREIDLIEF